MNKLVIGTCGVLIIGLLLTKAGEMTMEPSTESFYSAIGLLIVAILLGFGVIKLCKKLD